MKNPSTTRLASALIVSQNPINDERQWKTLMEGYILQWMDEAQTKTKTKLAVTM